MAAKYLDTITSTSGFAIKGGTVSLKDQSGAQILLYSDLNLTQSIGYTATSDDEGYVEFYVHDGVYNVTQSFSGVSRTIQNLQLYDLEKFRSDIDSTTSLGVLQEPTGASLIGAVDGASGSLWTTIQGFVSTLLSSAGSSVIGFLQAGSGAVLRTMQAKARSKISPDDFGAVGNGIADDTAAVNAAVQAVPNGFGKVYLEPGKTYLVTSLSNALNVGFWGDGMIVVGTGNNAVVLRSGSRAKGFKHWAYNRYRLFARINAVGTNANFLINGDSRAARGNTTVIGGISGTTFTVSNAQNATLCLGTYVTQVSPTCRIVSQTSGTTFGNGVYTLSESATIAAGSTIAVGNGGGFAGDNGEPQVLLKKQLRAVGIERLNLTNISIGSSTWGDLRSRNPAQYLNASTDGCIIPAIVNKGATIAQDIIDMRGLFADLRSSPYGSVTLCAIFLIGYSPTYDLTNGRTSVYQELMEHALLQAAEDYNLVFLNPREAGDGASWMPGNYLDALGVHPNGLLQQQFWAWVAEGIYKPREDSLSAPDDWIALTPAGTYTSYDNGFKTMRVRRSPAGERTIRGAIAPPGGVVTANDTLSYLPNQNYYPDASLPVTAHAYNGSTGAYTLLPCGIDVDGRIYARAAATGVTAILFPIGTSWDGWSST